MQPQQLGIFYAGHRFGPHPSWSHNCSTGSGLQVGHSILFTPKDRSWGGPLCCGDHHLQNLISISLALRLAQILASLVFPPKEMLPHVITLPPPKAATLSVQQSSQCPSAHVANSSANLPDGEQQSWQASWQPYDPGDWPWESGLDFLGRAQSVILFCKPWLKIYRSLTSVPKCWQGEETVFLLCRLLGIPISSPVWHPASNRTWPLIWIRYLKLPYWHVPCKVHDNRWC